MGEAMSEPTETASGYSPHGCDLFGEINKGNQASILGGRFLLPPFSVLSARDGWWQDRKRAWLSLGIQSELGRGETAGNKLTMSDTIKALKPHADKAGESSAAFKNQGALRALQSGVSNAARTFGQDLMRGEYVVGSGSNVRPGGGDAWAGKARRQATATPYGAIGAQDDTSRRIAAATPSGLTWQGKAAEFDGYRVQNGERAETNISGTSIFDPVLCEIAYRWFSPPSGLVLDPFAGGSVRGIVAAKLGREYIGCDLRAEQVEANREQAGLLCAGSVMPVWVCGDSATEIPALECAPDFIFSCPPYGDLEVYSDDPADLSNMPLAVFRAAYRAIIAAAVAALKPDRFACFVVGDYRDKKGFYCNFVGETVAAFEAAGARLYNEAILVTAVGSLPIRVSMQFSAGRKLGKTHQNILIFVKGDPKRATAACGEI